MLGQKTNYNCIGETIFSAPARSEERPSTEPGKAMVSDIRYHPDLKTNPWSRPDSDQEICHKAAVV